MINFCDDKIEGLSLVCVNKVQQAQHLPRAVVISLQPERRLVQQSELWQAPELQGHISTAWPCFCDNSFELSFTCCNLQSHISLCCWPCTITVSARTSNPISSSCYDFSFDILFFRSLTFVQGTSSSAYSSELSLGALYLVGINSSLASTRDCSTRRPPSAAARC